MFTVYHSNQVDVLADLLGVIMQQTRLDKPFQKEMILVQSPGMAQWLKLEMAKKQGIVANIEFPLPATFIWQMFTQVLSDVPARSFFNKEAMCWKLMKILPTQFDDPDFFELKQYLLDDIDGQKCYQLAGKIADIFDQYLVYRPEWIKAWENEKTVPELEQEKTWQPKLWRALYDYTLQLGQSPFHRANLYDEFIDTLTSHAQKPAGLVGIDRIFIFGISALPPRYLHALKALGEHIDVHYMFTNPCRYFWGDIRDKRYLAKRAATNHERIIRISASTNSAHDKDPVNLNDEFAFDLEDEFAFDPEDEFAFDPEDEFAFDPEDESALVGNSLLASMGKLGRDNLLLVSDLQCHEIDQGFVDSSRDSLLSHIQGDILDLLEPGDIGETLTSESKQEIALDDRSFMVEVCHSPMREIDVLHDRLLAMFEADPSLTPRDIIVMVVDINAYGPAISAIFGNAPGERYIPFSISDRSASQESPILSTFLRLLSLADQRCSAAQLLETLEVPSVLRRFGFDNRQFEKVKFWVEEAGIRWGLDEKTAAQFSLPEQGQNTWLFGLNRMLLGYAMPSQSGLYNGILSYDEVQGLEADVAGKLVEFFRVIMDAQANLMTPKSGPLWVQTLLVIFDAIFALDDDEELASQLIRRQLDNWLIQLNDADFSESLSLPIVRDYLKEKLGAERASQRFLSGRVNFCTLMPMRSIPFRVVCLLGMNDGDYPRTIAPLGFDLMVGRASAGDRSRREDDRYLFLEALQSAQQRLYISYVGRSVQDNSLKVPSVLVTELLDYCRQGYCLLGDQHLPEHESGQRLLDFFIHQNPLEPFSPQNFDGEMQSYAAEWLASAKGMSAGIKNQKADFLSANGLMSDTVLDTGMLELTELQRFWRLPVQYFFNRRLNVYFERPPRAMADAEPFSLNNLHRYQLRDALLCHLIAHGDSDASMLAFYQRQRASGSLPLNHFGELTLEAEQISIQAQYQTLKPFLHEKIDALEVNLKIPTSRGIVKLQGWLDGRYRSGRVLYRSGKIRATDRLSAWIDNLCQSASGESIETHFFGVEEQLIYAPLDQDDAIKQLAFYLETYFSGIDAPFFYLPATALAGLEVLYDKKGKGADEYTQEKAHAKMRLAFDGGFARAGETSGGEGKNVYVARVWTDLTDSALDEILVHAEQVLLPPLLAGYAPE